jgi:hypothetical protein
MIVNKVYDNIYEIENFITDDECESILNIISKLNEKDWFCEDEGYTSPDFWIGKSMFFTNPYPSIIDNINKRIVDLFLSLNRMSSVSGINRYSKDQAMAQHRDNHTKDGDEYSAFGVVLYYNDNYLGGLIEYPELDIRIKPKAKSLIIHGGDILHGTSPIIDNGIRYFSTAFVKEKPGSPAILNPIIFKDK